VYRIAVEELATPSTEIGQQRCRNRHNMNNYKKKYGIYYCSNYHFLFYSIKVSLRRIGLPL
jgi:hypothetical protein